MNKQILIKVMLVFLIFIVLPTSSFADVNRENICTSNNGTWEGDNETGYCIYPQRSDMESFKDLGGSFITLINGIDVSNIKNIGMQISPKNPTRGWVIFTLFIIFIYSMNKTLPYIVRSKLEQTRGKDGSLPLYVKYSIGGIIAITAAILWWAKDSLNPLMWKEIGIQVAPQNALIGWVLFFIGLYYVLWVFAYLLPGLLKRKFAKTNPLKKKKKEVSFERR